VTRFRALVVLTALIVAPLRLADARSGQAAAQSPADLIALGDAAYTARRQKEALDYFSRALAADSGHYEALWKASRSEIDLAEIAASAQTRAALLAAGQQHAEAAVRARPGGVEGHFSVARAAGRRALSAGVRERVRFSKIIRDAALAALKIDSTHAGAMHVLGMWNAEIMRLSGLSRTFARAFLGADALSLASWDEAQRLLESAVQQEPRRIIHRLDLAGIYTDRGDTARARELYVWIASAPVVDPNDDVYKRQAAERVKRLGKN
jgi:tetratricopeptide (TPR) repeat protein